ncbi:hypothetical protein V7S43_011948 [Phytophthora oleae]|uniref:Uncharacterized protein n=1 Tax=Phytophthora oleae TaxID=2107226 RepID=A0ABD3FAK4_9STRA
MFDTVRVDQSVLEARLNQFRHHRNRIKKLLMLQLIQRAKVSRIELLQSLGLSEADYETDESFSQEEFELLRQLRKEQSETGRNWASSPLVTTIMFNIVAASNKNHRLHIRRRSYATIEKSVAATPTPPTAESQVSRASSTRPKLFSFSNESAMETKASPHEQAFQLELFHALRATRHLTSVKKVFLLVYDFASSLCKGIHPKAEK